VTSYATHQHPTAQAWLARNPRITMHFTPTSGSWLNMVEIFAGRSRSGHSFEQFSGKDNEASGNGGIIAGCPCRKNRQVVVGFDRSFAEDQQAALNVSVCDGAGLVGREAGGELGG
jgi:hypothetical protein